MADVDLTEFAIIGLQFEIARMESELADLRAKLASLTTGSSDAPKTARVSDNAQRRTAPPKGKARNFSPEGRARIAAATRKRWERVRAEKAAAAAKPEVAGPPMPRHVKKLADQ